MDSKINILVVEDEPIVALDLVTGLETAGYEVAGIATNSRDAKSLFLNNAIDITLMDIHLKGEKDGVDTVRELMEIRPTPVIYLTAFSDHDTISRVKNTYPAAFLTKPYRIDNVLVAIELALHNFVKSAKPSPGEEHEPVVQSNDHLFIKVNYRFIKIPIAAILYITAENSYIHLVTADRRYPLRMVLSQFMEKISTTRIVRIHRSYAVNLDNIQSFTDTEVTVGKDTLPISKSYRDGFLQQFGLR